MTVPRDTLCRLAATRSERMMAPALFDVAAPGGRSEHPLTGHRRRARER
jgi:hypothetical protein